MQNFQRAYTKRSLSVFDGLWMVTDLQALRHKSEVEELEGNPQLPVSNHCAFPVLLQLRLDIVGITLQSGLFPQHVALQDTLLSLCDASEHTQQGR